MRQKELVSRKIFELKNLVQGQKSLIATSRTKEEIFQHLDRLEAKLQEIEILVNRENQDWN